ncbi:EamA family transporter [Streptosporangium sp. NPDC051022]|uniref:DMT family transporter n=1 Tax=Streptosporangium sp. NPDC051022 TaxID=3155752 RepID=UPI0034421BE9
MTHVSVRRGLLYVSVAATAWGTGGAAGALLHRASGLGPVSVSFWRFAVGAATLLLASRLLGLGPASGPGRPSGLGRPAGLQRLSALRRLSQLGRLSGLRRLSQPRRLSGLRRLSELGRLSGPGRVVVTGTAMAVYQTAYFAAIAESGLAVATVITMGATAVLVATGARLLLRERLGPAGVGSVVIALIGLVALALDGGSATFSLPGIGWALLSAAGYAGVTLLNRAVAGEPYATTAGSLAVGCLCLLPVALSQGLLPLGDPITSSVIIVYLGTIPTAAAYGLFFAGLTAVRATTATVISLVEPVCAAVIGVLLLGERLTPQAACGSALLLAAVGLLALDERGDDRTRARPSRENRTGA